MHIEGQNQIMVKNRTQKIKTQLIRYLPSLIQEYILHFGSDSLENLEEIRFRAEKPVVLEYGGDMLFLGMMGNLIKTANTAIKVSREEIVETLEKLCENSIYAYMGDLKQGFITVPGGHRVGICGKTVIEDGKVKCIRDVSGLNIRIANEVKGCAMKIMPFIRDTQGSIFNTLIISPPQAGKTTYLRDIARILGDGMENKKVVKIGIVDERSEIAACYKGVPQNDVGMMTDVLDGCPKTAGMMLLLRSMSPEVIIVDEIGGEQDLEAIRYLSHAGVKFIASMHGYGFDGQVGSRMKEIFSENLFERYIVLSRRNGPGTVKGIYDGISMQPLLEKKAYGN